MYDRPAPEYDTMSHMSKRLITTRCHRALGALSSLFTNGSEIPRERESAALSVRVLLGPSASGPWGAATTKALKNVL